MLLELDISIVTYNSSKWIENFFTSLVNQTCPLNKINLYITDNNSSDETLMKLKEKQESLSHRFLSFNVYQEENLGFGHGHNNNFSYSSSKFILVTNIDLEFESDAIEQVLNYAQSDDSQVASWEFRQKPYEHPKYYNPVTLQTTWSSSACVLFRKKVIDDIRGYDSRIFMYGEDVELSYRLRDNGYLLKYYPKAICWHYTYEEANQVKKLQFLGSTLANIYIRFRYGTSSDIKEGLKAYIKLFKIPKLFETQRIDLFLNLLKIIKNFPYFIGSKAKNKDIQYKFLAWDYEFIRDGAFYQFTEEKITNAPLVSVIIRTCCFRFDYLKEAVESVKNQTYDNIELVIVEDGSSDSKGFVDTIKSSNIKSISYTPIKKSGRCHAGNIGLEHSTGKYLVFLDDDDLFFADHIEVLVAELEQNINLAAAYSSAYEVPTEVVSKEPLVYIERSHNVIYRQPFSRYLMWHHNYIPIQAILFKRELYERYGGFDEDLQNLEDWNLWTRYSLENDFKYIPKTTSLYRVPFNNDIAQERKEELDRYYEVAIEKQKEIVLSMTPLEVINITKELIPSFSVPVETRSEITKKEAILKLLSIIKLDKIAQKIYHKLKGY